MRYLRQQGAQPQSNPSTTFIYGLVDPRTCYVRYVGKANQPKARLSSHLSPSLLKRSTRKNNWLNDLRSVGKMPDIIILENVIYSNWQETEKKWIRHYRNLPNYPPLTNIGDGGEGAEISPEIRKRIALEKVGKPMPPGTGAKISAANRGRIISESARISISAHKEQWWQNATDEEKQNSLKSLLTPYTESKRKKRSLDARKSTRKPDATSRYRNVIRTTVNGVPKWKSGCIMGGRQMHIGFFDIEEDAARARDIFVLKYIGEEVPLNFPRSQYSDSDISNSKPKYGLRKDNTSGYMGVAWYKAGGKWRTLVRFNKKAFHLGYFPPTEEGKIDAAKTFDRWIIEHLDEFAYTNFPRSDYE